MKEEKGFESHRGNEKLLFSLPWLWRNSRKQRRRSPVVLKAQEDLKAPEGRNLTNPCNSTEKQTKWDGGWVRKIRLRERRRGWAWKNNDSPSNQVNGPNRRATSHTYATVKHVREWEDSFNLEVRKSRKVKRLTKRQNFETVKRVAWRDDDVLVSNVLSKGLII